MTREEAIRILASSCISGSKQTEALETLIPELAESEDERMMREFNDWLCEEIECRTNDLRDEKDRRTLNMLCYILTKVKDWLEKQKPSFRQIHDGIIWHNGLRTGIELEKRQGRNPADLSEMMIHKEPYIAPVPTPMVADEQKPIDYDAELEKCKHNFLYFWDKYVTVKRKTVKWSKEDEEMLQSIIKDFRDGNISSIGQEQWLKSLPERLNLQPKQEWSEEDETALGDLMWCIEQARKSAKDENDMGNIWFAENWVKNRLKSLPERFNLQPKEEQSKYDGNMDKECIKLCNTLNSIPSIDTFESCCGHLKDSYSVWFFCNDTIAISRLGRSVDRNYSDGKWELVVDTTDTHPTGVFWLRSKVPFQSYDEMEESVNELCVGIQYWFNTKFDSYFNNNACK